MIRRHALAGLVALLATAPSLAAQPVAFTGATVWDGTGSAAMANATILVRDGRIVAVGRLTVPDDARVVSLTGKFVVPGMVNAHGHASGYWAEDRTIEPRARLEETLRLYARYGVTTVNSLGGEPEAARAVRADQNRSPLGRARVYYAGPVIAARTADAARDAVRANAGLDPDWIKIRVDDNLGTVDKMPWEAVEGVLEEADGLGLRVATHVFYLEDAKRLLDLGTDLIAHSVRDQNVDSDLSDRLMARDVCYVPTLTRELSTFAYAFRPPFFDDPFFLKHAKAGEVARLSDSTFAAQVRESEAARRYRVALGQAQRNLRALSLSGVRIAMGTDSGPAGRFPGYFEHLELALMAEAGLAPDRVLLSATSAAAACLGLDDVGSLEPGKWADFLVLGADPLADVANTRSLERVFVAGSEVR